jgi:hypothetical protein
MLTCYNFGRRSPTNQLCLAHLADLMFKISFTHEDDVSKTSTLVLFMLISNVQTVHDDEYAYILRNRSNQSNFTEHTNQVL